MVIICGKSAWEYYCTPPIVRDAGLPFKLAISQPPFGLGIPRSILKLRANACEASQLVSGRLLFDLKGIRLPIDVYVTQGSRMQANKIVTPHRLPRYLPKDELVKLGNDLYITSPRLTLLNLASQFSWQKLSLLMLEACGLFAIFHGTHRSNRVLKEIAPDWKPSALMSYHGPSIAEYCNENGQPFFNSQNVGPSEAWSPCPDRFGKLTELWKRPPLCTSEELKQIVDGAKGAHGRPTARKAASQIENGSGSPLEARLFLLLCSSASCGGENWERPSLNRRVLFTKEAQALSSQSHCACDFLWVDKKTAIEAKGKAYHADVGGFEIENGRRAALEFMGYTVFDITYSQMANLNRFNTMVKTFSKHLGFSLRDRTPTFLKRREELHRELFDRPDRRVYL